MDKLIILIRSLHRKVIISDIRPYSKTEEMKEGHLVLLVQLKSSVSDLHRFFSFGQWLHCIEPLTITALK